MGHPTSLIFSGSSCWKSVARHIGTSLLYFGCIWLGSFILPDSWVFVSRFGKVFCYFFKLAFCLFIILCCLECTDFALLMLSQILSPFLTPFLSELSFESIVMLCF